MMPSIDNNTVLFAAAAVGNIEQASAAVAAGGDVNVANAYHVTPLLEATGQGHLEMAQWLIDQGASIDSTEMEEGSPLMLTAFMGQDDFLRLFIKAGANVNIALPNSGETALHMAAATGKTAAVTLLLEAGGDPNLPTKTGIESATRRPACSRLCLSVEVWRVVSRVNDPGGRAAHARRLDG